MTKPQQKPAQKPTNRSRRLPLDAYIARELGVVDAAIEMVVELHADNDFLLAGSMYRLLEKRVELLVAGERAVAGTPHRHLYDAELRITMDRLLAAKSMFGYLAHQQTEQPETLVGVDDEF
jgi:hypothetical protein